MKTLYTVARRMGMTPRVLLDACRERGVDPRAATAADLEGIVIELEAASRPRSSARAFSLEGPIAQRLDGPGVAFRVDDVTPVEAQTPTMAAHDYVHSRLRATPVCTSVSGELSPSRV